MSKRITVDPVTRIEGHLRIDVEVDGAALRWSGMAGNGHMAPAGIYMVRVHANGETLDQLLPEAFAVVREAAGEAAYAAVHAWRTYEPPVDLYVAPVLGVELPGRQLADVPAVGADEILAAHPVLLARAVVADRGEDALLVLLAVNYIIASQASIASRRAPSRSRRRA